jgi:hypothetical protein
MPRAQPSDPLLDALDAVQGIEPERPSVDEDDSLLSTLETSNNAPQLRTGRTRGPHSRARSTSGSRRLSL